MLTKQQIEQACQNGHPAKVVKVLEWDGAEVALRQVTQQEWETLRARQMDGDRFSDIGLVAGVLELCICDDQGARLYSDGDLPAMPRRVAMQLFDEARPLAGLSDEDIEELAGKSEGTTGG